MDEIVTAFVIRRSSIIIRPLPWVDLQTVPHKMDRIINDDIYRPEETCDEN